MGSYRVKYRRFDQLMAVIQKDFKVLDNKGLLDPQDFIADVIYLNETLGVKIQKTKQTVLNIRNRTAALPLDFNLFNFGGLIHEVEQVVSIPQHVKTHYVAVPENTSPLSQDLKVCLPSQPNIEIPVSSCGSTCNTCSHEYSNCLCVPSSHVMLSECGGKKVIIREYKEHLKIYSKLTPIKLVNSPDYVDDYCIQPVGTQINHASISNGFIKTNFSNGTLYLNYEGLLEDEEGNLLVLDHPIINSYYEYHLKEKCIEIALINDVKLDQNLISLIMNKNKFHRNQALNLVRIPELNEIKEYYSVARKAFYNKHFSVFRTS